MTAAEGEWDRLDRERGELIARADRYADLGLGVHADLLRAGEPVPPSTAGRPVIIDTDIGGDPDDAVALAVAALSVPALSLVVTTDEVEGERARFARHLLDLCGRHDVPVAAGRQHQAEATFTAVGLTPASVGPQPRDVIGMVESACDGQSLVRWVGMGPMSNLAEVLDAHPHLPRSLTLTQMGGAVRYRDPSRAEHNIRLDPGAAREVLMWVNRARLVTSDVTFTPEIEVSARSRLHREFSGPAAPAWGQLLRSHLDQWFERCHSGSMQHDALTLSAALQLPFVDFHLRSVSFDAAGRMSVGAGAEVFLSRRAHYTAFVRWLERQLLEPDLRRPAGSGQ